MIDIMAVKLKVIKAAFGIASLSEIDLLHRLEELYLEGVSEGLRVAKTMSERSAEQHSGDGA
jgi:hypothetical protein